MSAKTIYHKHHIIPRHAGGTDDASNIIILSVEEHAQAHKNLWEKHGRPEDELAWKGLSGMISKQEIIKELCSMGGKKGGAIGGKKGKGRKQSEQHIEKRKCCGIKNGMYGKTLSTEHKNKISLSSIEACKKSNFMGSDNLRKSSQEKMINGTHPSQIIWTCEYCHKVGKSLGNYKKYHGERCKNKN